MLVYKNTTLLLVHVSSGAIKILTDTTFDCNNILENLN